MPFTPLVRAYNSIKRRERNPNRVPLSFFNCSCLERYAYVQQTRISGGLPKRKGRPILGGCFVCAIGKACGRRFRAVGLVEVRMVVDRLPGAGGVGGDAEVTVTVRVLCPAGGTAAGFHHIAGFGAHDRQGAGILILNPPQEPVGENLSLRVIRGGSGFIGVSPQHLPHRSLSRAASKMTAISETVQA